MGRRRTDFVVGQRFGRLVVLSQYPEMKRDNAGKSKAWWACRCDCGVERQFLGWKLRIGRVQSCGCGALEARERTQRKPKYGEGLSKDPALQRTYTSWSSMRERCLNPKSDSWANYGGRGIMICDRWRHDFTSFLEDMGLRPEGRTLGRIDNEGGYEPANCSWQTNEEQAYNKRITKRLPDGEPVGVMCSRLGLNRSAVTGRINNGWDVDDAITLPIRSRMKNRTQEEIEADAAALELFRIARSPHFRFGYIDAQFDLGTKHSDTSGIGYAEGYAEGLKAKAGLPNQEPR